VLALNFKLLRNSPPGGGTRDLLKASYSLLHIRERMWKCVFHNMGCVITIGNIYTIHVPLSQLENLINDLPLHNKTVNS